MREAMLWRPLWSRKASEAPVQFLSHKREKRLIRTAAAAYRKLAALE